MRPSLLRALDASRREGVRPRGGRHHSSDTKGHRGGVNPSVPLVLGKVRRRVGEVATFEDAPRAHQRLESSFDVVQVAAGKHAPQACHDFIGFEVARPLLERAFLRTYGLEMKDVLPRES